MHILCFLSSFRFLIKESNDRLPIEIDLTKQFDSMMAKYLDLLLIKDIEYVNGQGGLGSNVGIGVIRRS